MIIEILLGFILVILILVFAELDEIRQELKC